MNTTSITTKCNRALDLGDRMLVESAGGVSSQLVGVIYRTKF